MHWGLCKYKCLTSTPINHCSHFLQSPIYPCIVDKIHGIASVSQTKKGLGARLLATYHTHAIITGKCRHTHVRASACERDGTRTRARLHSRALCTLMARGTLHLPLILKWQECARVKPRLGYKRRFTVESLRLSSKLRVDVLTGERN